MSIEEKIFYTRAKIENLRALNPSVTEEYKRHHSPFKNLY